MLADSRGTPDTGVDVQSVEGLLQSCGEELDTDEYEQVMRLCGHDPTKGKFDVTKILKTYADLATKVGSMEQSEKRHVDELCKNISSKKTRP